MTAAVFVVGAAAAVLVERVESLQTRGGLEGSVTAVGSGKTGVQGTTNGVKKNYLKFFSKNILLSNYRNFFQHPF